MATTVEEVRAGPAPVTEEERLRREHRRQTINKWVFRILGYVAVVLVWQFGFRVVMEVFTGRSLDDNLLPTPTRVLETFPDIWDHAAMLLSFKASLTKILVGFSLSLLVGTAIGIFTQHRWLDSFFRDLVVISLTAPALIWALVAAITFGFSPVGPAFAIVLSTFAITTVNVSEGIRALPKDLIDMGRAFDVGIVKRNREIVFPHLAPYLFTAVRFGFSVTWKVTVLTEIFSSNEGIGFEMRTAWQSFRVDELLTWILSFFVFVLVLEKVVLQYFERRFFRWRQEVVIA